MTATMHAVVLDAPGPPEALVIRELPVPEPRPGWVLIRVKAFGINRSELHTRLGLAQGITFPACSASRPPASSPLHPEPSSSKASKSPR
jgi:NADPH:quinone reductase-like Zn-dependent oxidoreductase